MFFNWKNKYKRLNIKQEKYDILHSHHNYSKLVQIPIHCSKLLKIKYNILLRLSLYLQLKNSKSLSSFIILMSCLYYFKWSGKKNRTFDVGRMVKWSGKIDKIVFWGAKS